MKRFLLTLLAFTLLTMPGVASAFTYNWYFSNAATGTLADGSDAAACSEAAPCKSLSKMQDMLDTVTASDTATLWLDRADTWTITTGYRNSTGRITAWSTARDGVLWLEYGAVTIKAYGTGAKPILDGGETFASTPLTSTKQSSDAVIQIKTSTVTIENLNIKNFHGNAIATFEAGVHDITVQDCDSSYLGQSFFNAPGSYLIYNSVVQRNSIDHSQMLEVMGYTSHAWSGTIHFQGGTESGSTGKAYGITVKNNVITYSGGEGIITGSHSGGDPNIIEYNVIGDSMHPFLHVPPVGGDAGVNIVRYNLLYSTTAGRAAGYTASGIYIEDEVDGGDNSTADIQIYGNLMAGLYRGFFINPSRDNYGKIWIYQNTLIDVEVPIYIANNMVDDLDFYNNTSIQYDLSGTHISNPNSKDVSTWGVDNNHFYGGTVPASAPWNTNIQTGDPKLTKTSGWRSLSAAPTFDDFYPSASDSDLVNNGKALGSGYGQLYFTVGTDFSTLPTSETFTMVAQLDNGTHDIGGIVFSEDPPPAPVGGAAPTGTYVLAWNGDYTDDTDQAWTADGASNAAGTINGSPTIGATHSVSGNAIRISAVNQNIEWAGGDVNPSEDTVWLHVYPEGSNGGMIFEIYQDDANHIFAYLDGTGNVHLVHRGQGVSVRIDDSTESYVAGQDNTIGLRWSVSGNVAGIKVNSADWQNDIDEDAVTAFPAGTRYVTVGESARVASYGVFSPIWIDNLSVAGVYNQAAPDWTPADVTAPTVTALGVCSDASCTACTTDLTDAWGAETVRVCAALSEDVIVTVSPTWQMDCGPVSGDKVTGSYFQKIDIAGTKYLTAQFTFTDRMRFSDPQLYEMTGGTIQDGSGNDLDTSGSAGDISSGALTIGVAGTFSVGTFSGTDEDGNAITWSGEYGTMTALRAAVDLIDNDVITWAEATESAAVDLSALTGLTITLGGNISVPGAGLNIGDATFHGAGYQVNGAFTHSGTVQRVISK